MNVFKKVIQTIIIVAIIALLVVVLVLSCVPKQKKSDVELVKLADIHIPEKLDQDNLFGLFFFDENGVPTPVKDGVDKVCYDKNKPTIIFIHGMQMNYGYHRYDPIANADGIVKAGYNFGVFFWSQLADCGMPGVGKKKIWGRTSGNFFYADENDNRVEEADDVLKYATSEVFVAYYLDFMEKAGCDGSSVTITGHSLGANTLFAVTSYMTTLYKEGLITKEFLPDRFTYLDAYMDALVDKDTYVPWLKHTIGEEGVIGLAKEAVAAARELGIATEYVKSCQLVSFLSDTLIYGGVEGTSKSLFDKMLYLDFSCAFAAKANFLNMFGDEHCASMNYALRSVGEITPKDVSDPNGEALAFNLNTPISYSYARNGAIYRMETNKTEFNFDDDVFYSENISCAKIAGFAFNDANDNGINDDRVKNRVGGVTVKLYDEGGNFVAETKTSEGGYYEFNLKQTDVGKSFTVRAELDGGKFGKTSDGGYMNNGVNAQGVSAKLRINSAIDLKIVNIGINK